MMRALRLHRIGTAPVVDLIEVPGIAADELLIRVHAAGICGSDRHIVEGHNPLPAYPRTLGHEIAGEVADVGADVEVVQAGDRVAVNFLISCGSCDYCEAGRTSLCMKRLGLGVAFDGGLADYVVVRSSNVIPIPDNVPYSHAAIATDAFATPLHAIRRSGVQSGEPCLVLGAGGLGLSAIQLLSALGAGHITAVDVDSAALDAALRAGATAAKTAGELEAMNSIGDSLSVHHAFDFVGSPQTVAAAIENTGRGGRINVVGLSDRPIELVRGDVLVREEKIIAGSYSFDNNEIGEVLQLMSRGLIRPESVIGNRIDLDQAPDLLDPAGTPGRGFGRTVVEFDPARLIQMQIQP